VATITFRADQVVSGVVINFIAGGATLYLVKLLFEGAGETSLVNEVFHKVKIPLLSDIPILGDGLFNAYPTTYLALILVAVVYYVLYKSPYGLRLRSVGEHPSAADTVGIKVLRMRYSAVLLSGVLAGLGGATIAMTTTGSFSHNTISGQGFIALAAVIFGKWNPLGALGAALFFGFAQSINNVLQLFDFSYPRSVGVHLHAALRADDSRPRRRGRPFQGAGSVRGALLPGQEVKKPIAGPIEKKRTSFPAVTRRRTRFFHIFYNRNKGGKLRNRRLRYSGCRRSRASIPVRRCR